MYYKNRDIDHPAVSLPTTTIPATDIDHPAVSLPTTTIPATDINHPAIFLPTTTISAIDIIIQLTTQQRQHTPITVL